jgi:DNA polymerase zeta
MEAAEPFPRPFKFRLNCIDHYQTSPAILDPDLPNASSQGSQRPSKVPVIRVFGSTETGQKVCAHIHGAFPYLFVEYKGSLKVEEGVKAMHHMRFD